MSGEGGRVAEVPRLTFKFAHSPFLSINKKTKTTKNKEQRTKNKEQRTKNNKHNQNRNRTCKEDRKGMHTHLGDSVMVALLTGGVSLHSSCTVLWWRHYLSATAIKFWYGGTACSINKCAQNKNSSSLLTWSSLPSLSRSHLCTPPPPPPLPLFFSFLP